MNEEGEQPAHRHEHKHLSDATAFDSNRKRFVHAGQVEQMSPAMTDPDEIESDVRQLSDEILQQHGHRIEPGRGKGEHQDGKGQHG